MPGRASEEDGAGRGPRSWSGSYAASANSPRSTPIAVIHPPEFELAVLWDAN